MSPREIANIILNITFAATFIGVFFFTYGSYIERQIIRDQMDYIVNSVYKDINTYVPNKYVNMFLPMANNIPIPDLLNADNIVADKNRQLIKTAGIVLLTLFTLGLSAAYVLSKKYGFNLRELIIDNIVVLIFIALTEFVFLTFIGRYYRSGDPNYIKLGIVQALLKVHD